MKPLTLTGLAALFDAGRGQGISEAESAAQIGGAALCASFAILAGLIKTGAADGPAMRAYLQGLYDGMAPAERHTAMGHALSQVIAGLDANLPAGSAALLAAPARPH
jgi:hypothetical protein